MLQSTKDINASDRKIGCKLTINGVPYTNIKRLSYASEWSGNITIGQVVSSYFTATMPTPATNISGANVTLEMSINGEGVAIGQYIVDNKSIQKKQGFTTFSAYDRLHSALNTYRSNLTYPTKLQNICNEVCSAIGITSCNLPIDYTVAEDILSGYTLRDVLGFIAAMCGKNAFLDANNKLVLKWFENVSYTADGTNANYPYTGENTCTVSRLICQTADGVISSGSGEGIYFTCPLMHQNWLDWVLTQVNGFTFNKADVDIPKGSFLLQTGDVINVNTSNARSSIKVPIMSNSWTYDGGIHSSVAAYDVTDYTGTANNAERSASVRRVLSIMENKKAVSREKANTQFLQNEIETATKLITGATGGYIKLNFGGDGKTAELLVMDTPSIETAQNVWIFNQNGLGHMYRKEDGTFDNVNLALTRDGHIVAEVIAGEKIAGVALESTSNDSQVIVKDGQYNINYVYGENVTPVAKMYYRNRKAVDDTYCFGIDVKPEDGQFSIGSAENAEFFYYSGKMPTGARKFNFFGDVRIENGALYFSGMNVNDKMAEYEQRIQALEERIKSLEGDT